MLPLWSTVGELFGHIYVSVAWDETGKVDRSWATWLQARLDEALSKRGWMLLTVMLGGLIGALALLWPLWQTAAQSDTEAPLAPDFTSTVRLENPRIVLPGSEATAAAVYFDLTNLGKRTVHLTEVRLGRADPAGMQNKRGPAWTPVAALAVHPGETLSFEPGSKFAAVSDYRSDVVPGATVDITLVFGTSAALTVPTEVFPAASTLP